MPAAQQGFWRRLGGCIKEGSRKGIRTAVWLLAIMIPISGAVNVLRQVGVLGWIAGWLEPVMKLVGLPGETAIAFIIGVALNIYSAIAAMGPMALTEREVTILALICLISHNFPVEATVQHKAGTKGWRIVGLRLAASAAAGIALNLMLPADAVIAEIEQKIEPTWLLATAKLTAKIVVLVMLLMVLQRILDEFGLIRVISWPLSPLLRLLGLPKSTAFLWIVANTLGRLEDPIATARLKELSERPGLLPRAKEAAVGALRVCGGPEAQKKTVAELFYDLALKYYYRAESLRPDRRYDKANVWRWKKDLGLAYTPVPRAIFCDVYAMRMARLALQYDEKYYPAVSLWLSAHIRKEVDLAGATDPIRAKDQPAAKYYALASPAVYLQHVLARAMRDKNSAVAVAAITALGETAGAMNLVKEVQGGAMPLVEAMTYEDRHVRFLAAWTLANAKPKDRFAGAEVVLWVLNEAIRQVGKKRALLIAADPTVRNSLKNALRGAGCEVIDEPDPVKALSAARAIGGVDVVALGTKPDPQTTVDMMRRDPSFAGVPVLMAAQGRAYRDMAARDKKMVVVNPAADTAAIKTALAAAAKLGGAPLSPEQAGQWAVRAAQSVRMLGLTKNKVYDVDRARLALIEALGDSRDAVQIAAAQALAILPAADAQRAIVTLAVTGTKENVRVAAFKAASESVRAFGRQTTDDQAKAVLGVVMGKGSPELLNSAAQLLGALNLPSEQIKPLILCTEGMD